MVAPGVVGIVQRSRTRSASGPSINRYASSRVGSAWSAPTGGRAADDVVAAGARPPADQCVVARLVGEPDLAHRRGDQVGDGTVEPDVSAGEHDHPLAQSRDVLGLVRGQQHRRAVTEGGQRTPEVGALCGVEAGGRLVEHDQLRVPEKGLGQPDPSTLPARQPADPDGRLVGEAYRVEHPTHLLGAPLTVVPLLEDRDVLDEPEGGHVRGVAELLRQVAELAAHLRHVRVGAVRVASEQPYLAAVGGDRGGDDAQQRGLAGSVGTEQPGDATVESEVDVGEGAGAAVPLADAGQLDGAGAHNATPGCRSVPARIAMTAQAATASPR